MRLRPLILTDPARTPAATLLAPQLSNGEGDPCVTNSEKSLGRKGYNLDELLDPKRPSPH